MSFLVSHDYLSPLSPFSPISQIKIMPHSTQITTANIFAPINPYIAYVDIDTGLNSSYIVQKDTTEYLWYRILDKWFYTDELCYLLSYLKVVDKQVKFASAEEVKNNKICNDTIEDIEMKTDFIQENLLTLREMKTILKRMIAELDYKWYELTSKERLVVEITGRHLKKMFERQMINK